MSYPIWRTKVFETLDRLVEQHGEPIREMVQEWVYHRDPDILAIISDKEVTCPCCADFREVTAEGLVKACEGEGCADGEFSMFSAEGAEHARRVLGEVRLPQFGQVFYQTWICFCCGTACGKESCVCFEKGRRSLTDPHYPRACTVCGKCSVHCPHNHTAGTSSGWEGTTDVHV